MTSILVVDDDRAFGEVLAGALQAQGHEVQCANNVTRALSIAQEFNPEWVLVDLQMPGQSGLELIPQLLEIDPGTIIVVLTGYATIATAVEAIKLGAVHYLSKPVSTEEILSAFSNHKPDPTIPIQPGNQTLLEAERDHIANAYERNGRNISATARELKMHRRTLQRKMDKLKIER